MKLNKTIHLATGGLYLISAAGLDPFACALFFAGVCFAAAAFVTD